MSKQEPSILEATAPENAGNGVWPIWKLALLFYPFVAAAVAINLFLAVLAIQRFGIEAITPIEALIGGIFLGPFFSVLVARWIQGLILSCD